MTETDRMSLPRPAAFPALVLFLLAAVSFAVPAAPAGAGGPAPATARVSGPIPFGSHRYGYAAGTILPRRPQAEMDAAVVALYARWKAAFLVEACEPGRLAVRSPDADFPYVAEAQGYGLEILALMDGADPEAQTDFDALLGFVLDHPSRINPALMAASQDGRCRSVDGSDSATDGDLSIAYALLLADQQWGSATDTRYRDLALKRIAAIAAMKTKRHGDVVPKGEIHPDSFLPLLGDWSRPGGGARDAELYGTTRPSDFMIDHFRAFKRASRDGTWGRVIAATQATIDDMQHRFAGCPGAACTGLVPDFVVDASGSDPHPADGKVLEGRYDGDYWYNALRVPWHLGVDAATSGDPLSRTAARRITDWAKAATAGDPAAMREGYHLDGTPIHPTRAGGVTFFAPLAPAAMTRRSDQPWLDALWAAMAEAAADPDLIDAASYYGTSLLLQSMIATSGNYWTPAD